MPHHVLLWDHSLGTETIRATEDALSMATVVWPVLEAVLWFLGPWPTPHTDEGELLGV